MKDKVSSYLEARKLMALATYDDAPWICNVYYVIDDNLNFYFKSSLDTQHIQHILSNNQVALTVSDSDQTPNNNKRAIQLNGTCERLSNIDTIKWFLNKWSDDPSKYDPEDLAKGNIAGVFKITPAKIKYFDTELFKEKHFIFLTI